MANLVRFGVSLERDLLREFDQRIQSRNYSNRSEAIRDMIRQELVQKQWQADDEVAGTVTLIYDHHKRELVNKLMDIQHDFGKMIIAAQHIHLDHSNCLEIVVVKGSARETQKLADMLKAVKGVKHSTLSMSTTGKGLR
ncbi:MAG TPA: nickel-responsive transcriptional regulator NikR [Candidatus Omnitrophota bacterium]|nr:nickel-responsive transcriptional regulator NikR [Candidatus Omnitrophota bacterium]HPT06634.1 nickel-responsive transcriptional regulator NikR [Candidatus Omnitrophota bacterium]